jgi:hypothetical protein
MALVSISDMMNVSAWISFSLASPTPAPQGSTKTDSTWLLQKVRKILDSTNSDQNL